MAVKWEKAAAGDYRAVIVGREFNVWRSAAWPSGWEYGSVRDDGELVSEGWVRTLAEAKVLCLRPRLNEVVRELNELDFDGMPYPEGAAAVLDILRRHRVDHAGFRELDEKPGRWTLKQPDGSYCYSSWHRPLRVVRNDREQPLFDVLAEAEVYWD